MSTKTKEIKISENKTRGTAMFVVHTIAEGGQTLGSKTIHRLTRNDAKPRNGNGRGVESMSRDDVRYLIGHDPRDKYREEKPNKKGGK